MQKVFLNILNKLDDNENNKISIPELGIETIVEDKMMAALLLLPLFKRSRTKDIVFQEKGFNKEKVLNVIEIYQKMNELDVDYIALFGEKVEEAYNYVKDKWENKFITNDMFRLIKKEHQIYVPIHGKGYCHEDLEALSTLGVTVMKLKDRNSTTFVKGLEVCYSPYDSVPFITFVNSMGFFIDEYLLGELLYYISTIDPAVKEIIIDNIDTVFVKSLSCMFSVPHFNYRAKSHGLDDGSEFSDLIGILKSYNFERIKNLQFSFVRRFLYEKK